MTHVTLTDTEWTRIRAFLKDDANAYIGTDEVACRRFVEAINWMSRSGTPLAPVARELWGVEYHL